MSDEMNNQEQVVVSEETINNIDNQVSTAFDNKVSSVKSEVDAELEAMKKELAAIKAQNAEVEARRHLEEEKAAIKAQLDKEKAYMEQVNKKHVVPQANNPIHNPTPSVGDPAAEMSVEQQLKQFHDLTIAGQMTAAVPIDEFKLKKY